MRTRFPLAVIALVVVLAAAGCSGSAGTTTPAKTPVPTLAVGPTPVATPVPPETIAPTEAATAVPTVAETPAASETAAATPAETIAPSPSPIASIGAECMAGTVATKTQGVLTAGTDNPAYPPYFKGREGGNTAPWDPSQGDPTTGKGFESAVAYAIAGALGFPNDKVTWVVVPFSNAFAPGAKKFDFDINQVSYTPERTQTADLSDGYYFGNQTVVTLKSSSFASATSIAELKSAKLGAQVGTTSYDAILNVIMPTTDPQVYDTNDGAIQALKNKQIDGILVDLPTADFITSVQLANSVIVGQLATGTPEHFSAVLAKDSPLTSCVNEAIAVLASAGTLQQLVDKWLPFSATPVLTP